MSRLLRLQANAPDVLALTRRALEQSNLLGVRPRLVIRCASIGEKRGCRAVLALVGYLQSGPLFTSVWMAARPSATIVNARRINARQERDRLARREAIIEDTMSVDEPHGVIALLALPLNMPADFPDLLVRCHRHGDRVLDRLTVLDRLRDGGVWEVSVAYPLHDYEPPDSSWLTGAAGSVTRRERLTVHYGRKDHPPSAQGMTR